MKKKSSVCCLFIFVVLALSNFPAAGQSADEILGKMIEAMGGRQVLEKINDMVIVAEVNVVESGLKAKVINSIKEPNLARVDIEMPGLAISQIFDGKTAWLIDPRTGIKEQVPEEAQKFAKRDALGFSSLLNPGKFGIIYSDVGPEKIDEKEYLVLEQKFEDGAIIVHYLDPETYLPFKSVARALNNMLVEVEEETQFSDYRNAGGVMVAHSLTVYQDGEKYMTSTVSSIKFNSGLEESLFGKGI